VTRIVLIFAAFITFAMITPARSEGIFIIANPSVDTSEPITRQQIAAIYLLRVTLWPDGTHIVPVNREHGCDIREQFTSLILRQGDDALAAYWNQMHFQGKLPPLVQESERAMVAFVRTVPGAIGYISSDTPPTGVKVLRYVPAQ
jgi:ABC-type phosphate transport system substrate-binding protein